MGISAAEYDQLGSKEEATAVRAQWTKSILDACLDLDLVGEFEREGHVSAHLDDAGEIYIIDPR